MSDPLVDCSFSREEQCAVLQIRAYGHRYGFGRMIQVLQQEWSRYLQEGQHFDSQAANAAAGFICAWCHIDKRTGKKSFPKRRATGSAVTRLDWRRG